MVLVHGEAGIGRRAQAAHAWTEASEAFERAAVLAASGAGSVAPIDLAELWIRAAWLADSAGDLKRGLALGRLAVESDDGADPHRSGALLGMLGTLANDAGDFELAVSASERAVELIPPEPPSLARAEAVGGLASRRMIVNRSREAIVLADEAIALSHAVDSQAVLGQVVLGHAFCIRACSAAALGRVDEARAGVEESMRIDRTIGNDAVLEAETIIVDDTVALFAIGDFERALAFVDEGMARATEIGSERGTAGWLEPTAAIVAFATGEWRVAAERLERFRNDVEAGFPLLDAVLIEADLAAGRGDRARVETLMAGEVETPSHDWFVGQFARVRAVAALWDGDSEAAARHMESALSIMSGQEELPSLTEIITMAVRAYADLAEHHRASRAPADAEAAAARAAELAGQAAALGAGTYLVGASSTPWMRASVAQVVAEAERAAGRSEPIAWAAASGAHAEVGTMPDVAYCRYRQGEALLDTGDRAAAASALGEARSIAVRVGMTPLLARVEALARLARLSLDTAPVAADPDRPAAPPDPWGLTAREREVLDLLAQGRTNRQIGEALFISGKTASVHVTHILDKLGVSSRTEAALLAGRSGAEDRDKADAVPSKAADR